MLDLVENPKDTLSGNMVLFMAIKYLTIFSLRKFKMPTCGV